NYLVVGLDIRNFLSITKFLDFFHIVPSFENGDELKEVILNLAKKYFADWFISGIEQEIILALEIENELNKINTKVFAPTIDTMNIIIDKYKFYRNLNNIVKMPETFTKEEFVFDVKKKYIAKPRKGRGSQKIIIINSLRDLNDINDEYIIQEYISGIEYSVDVLCDMNGNLLNAVPRKRIIIDSGISIVSQTERNFNLIHLCEIICNKLFFRGFINIQFMKFKDDYYLLDINPRFGGASILSYYSSGSLRRNLHSILTGRISDIKKEIDDIEIVRMERYYIEEFIKIEKN
ncbi:MAG: ATP-grasp domain-containing protein, partial [bacterium]